MTDLSKNAEESSLTWSLHVKIAAQRQYDYNFEELRTSHMNLQGYKATLMHIKHFKHDRQIPGVFPPYRPDIRITRNPTVLPTEAGAPEFSAALGRYQRISGNSKLRFQEKHFYGQACVRLPACSELYAATKGHSPQYSLFNSTRFCIMLGMNGHVFRALRRVRISTTWKDIFKRKRMGPQNIYPVRYSYITRPLLQYSNRSSGWFD